MFVLCLLRSKQRDPASKKTAEVSSKPQSNEVRIVRQIMPPVSTAGGCVGLEKQNMKSELDAVSPPEEDVDEALHTVLAGLALLV